MAQVTGMLKQRAANTSICSIIRSGVVDQNNDIQLDFFLQVDYKEIVPLDAWSQAQCISYSYASVKTQSMYELSLLHWN